ncbi:DUF4097 family beta strand repeat-containing protein [Tunicatimonas pelagia]|uniref:DUF4097 family beta strand repeat-containing protein n=1 Tax=Tunicatimonas pelagia TaxID=931531 RepID=UPI0026668409|nr:DUF4097 family beta strand repeat-containing protein [Tunicatimonas pelagia]WKN42891.1 DUF4097 family beta strand repeat-containing protein [Tunicatimonas pelagia]
MKIIIGILTFLWAGSLAYAQEYRATMSANTIRLVLHNTEVSIEGHDGNELIVNASGYKAPPKRADGLRPLYSSGTDNSGIGLSINEENGKVTVLKVGRNDVDYSFKIPKNTTVVIEEVNHAGGDIEMKNLSGEIEVKTTNSDVRLEDISGPVVANSVSGDIDVIFNTVNQQKPTSITIVSGDVDITLPSQTAANLKLGSVSGEVYTDFDIALDQSQAGEVGLVRMSMGQPIKGTINNGGVDMQVKTVSGNIYLRKSE